MDRKTATKDDHRNLHRSNRFKRRDDSVEKSDKLENGANTDGTKSNRYRKASGGLSKAEKEEGELSPTRDSDDDAPPSPVSPVEDLDIRSPQYEVGEAICSQDVVDDNDADADDEDSENASVAGEVSGSESAGEDCSHEENVAEHDEIYGKWKVKERLKGLLITGVQLCTDLCKVSS